MVVHEHARGYGSPTQPLSEYEVFIGNILGKTGAQSKRQHENSVSMQETFRDDLRYFVNRILNEGGGHHAGLGVGLACLLVALESEDSGRIGARFRQTLVSFGYVAASVCLWQLQLWAPFPDVAHMGGFRAIAIR